MKRSISISLIFSGLALLAAGCSSPEPQKATALQIETDWTSTPMIQQVVRAPEGLRLTGLTFPLGRVVVRGVNGPAYATSADEQGHFALTLTPPALDAVFAVEAQRGETAALAPYELVVARDVGGPIALRAEGAPTQRLDRVGPLDVIDSDGHALLASGRGAPDSLVDIRIEDRTPVQARTDGRGRWSMILMSDGARPVTLDVAGRRYAYPGPGPEPVLGSAQGASFNLTPYAEGWRAVWSLESGSWQDSWFPAD